MVLLASAQMQGFAKSEANENANEIMKAMSKIMLKLGVPLLAMGVVGGALSARAQGDINMTLHTSGGDYLSTASMTAPDGTPVSGNFGVFSFTVNSFNSPSGPGNQIPSQTGLTMGSTFNSVCLSPTGTLYFDKNYNYTYQSFSSVNAAGGLNPSGYFTANGLEDAAWLWSQYGSSVTTPNQGSALSLAMLELLYFGGPSGTFVANPKSAPPLAPGWTGDTGGPGSASSYYSQYLSDFQTAGSSVSWPSASGVFVPDVNDTIAADSYPPDGNPGQEFIFIAPSGQNGQPVPEPSTLISGALLLLPLGAITLRILRKKSIAS